MPSAAPVSLATFVQSSAVSPTARQPLWIARFARQSDSPTSSAASSPHNVQLMTIGTAGNLNRIQILSAANRLEPATAVSGGLARNAVDRSQLFQPIARLLQRLPMLHRTNEATPDLTIAPSRQQPANPSVPLPQGIGGLAMNAEGTLVAVATAAGIVELRQVEGDRFTQVIRPFATVHPPADGDVPVAIRQLAFSPNGQLVLGIGDDRTVRLWDTQTGQQIQVLRGHTATIQSARFSPNGQWIITASWDRTARVWTTAGALVKELTYSNSLASADISPTGNQIVTTSWDGTAQLWQLNSDRIQRLVGHEAAVLDAHFSPDGRSIVTASADGSARLWQVEDGSEQALLQIAGRTDPLVQARFSPDGHYVMTLSQSGQTQLWAGSWQTLLKLAADRSSRQLSSEECRHYLRLTVAACPILPE